MTLKARSVTLGLASIVAAGLVVGVLTPVSSAYAGTAQPPTVAPRSSSGLLPAAVADRNNPFHATPIGEVHGVLYGTGYKDGTPGHRLQQWTGFHWENVPGQPAKPLYGGTVWSGTLLFESYDSATNRSTIWKYDGTTFAQLKTFAGAINLQASGSNLTIFANHDEATSIYTFDGTRFSEARASTMKSISGTASLSGKTYAWVDGAHPGLFRVDSHSFTRVLTSPVANTGVEWHGSLYFGAYSDSQGLGIYRFDGSQIQRVDTGVAFDEAGTAPVVATYENDLFFAVNGNSETSTLYDYDGTSSKKVGLVAGKYTQDFVEFDSKLFFGVSTETSTETWTWIFDPLTAPGTAVASTVPTISGAPTVGTALKIATGDWGATAKLSVQWKRNGETIKGATRSRYTITPADIHHTLTVTLTGTAPGYQSTNETSSRTESIAAGTMSARVKMSTSPTVGRQMVALVGGLTPAKVHIAYRWVLDGKPIPEATLRAYTPTRSMAGHVLTVRIHAECTGYRDARASASPQSVGRVLTKTPSPTIAGTPKVGMTVKAVAGSWAPAPVGLHYQWKRSGTPIPGSTEATYRILKADRGKTLTVRVTGSKKGYTSSTKASATLRVG